MVSEDSVRGHLVVCFGLTILRQGLTAVGVGDGAVSSHHGCPEHMLEEHLCSTSLLLFPFSPNFSVHCSWNTTAHMEKDLRLQ